MIKTEQKLNFPAGSLQICTKASEQGSFFQAGQNEYKKTYVMIKTEQKAQFSQQILKESALKLKNRAHFSEPVEMSTRSPLL